MAGKRKYHDQCGVARALNLIGERWALLVVRELMFGPRRFGELKADLPDIATNILSQRLSDLEAGQVIERVPLDDDPRSHAYRLTDWGAELAPVFKVMGRWVARSPDGAEPAPADAPLSPSAAVLALHSHFRPQKSKGLSMRVACSVGGRDFTLTVADRQFDTDAGLPEEAEVMIEAEPIALLAILLDGTLPEALGGVTVDGNPEAFDRLVACFQRF